MSDLIDRQDLINGIFNDYPKNVLAYIAEFPSAQTEHATCYLDSPCEYQNINIALPSVEPKKGKWIDSSNGWMCSKCKRDNTFDTNYCPNCGARMEGNYE